MHFRKRILKKVDLRLSKGLYFIFYLKGGYVTESANEKNNDIRLILDRNHFNLYIRNRICFFVIIIYYSLSEKFNNDSPPAISPFHSFCSREFHECWEFAARKHF